MSGARKCGVADQFKLSNFDCVVQPVALRFEFSNLNKHSAYQIVVFFAVGMRMRKVQRTARGVAV